MFYSNRVHFQDYWETWTSIYSPLPSKIYMIILSHPRHTYGLKMHDLLPSQKKPQKPKQKSIMGKKYSPKQPKWFHTYTTQDVWCICDEISIDSLLLLYTAPFSSFQMFCFKIYVVFLLAVAVAVAGAGARAAAATMFVPLTNSCSSTSHCLLKRLLQRRQRQVLSRRPGRKELLLGQLLWSLVLV